MAETPPVTAEVLGGGRGQSQQVPVDEFNYDEHKCKVPPIPLVTLASLYDANVPHKASVDAKTVNAVGLGFRFEPVGKEDLDAGLVRELCRYLRLLARRDSRSFSELLIAAKMDEETIGFGAIEVTRNLAGRVDGLFHVHAFTLRRRIAKDGWVQRSDATGKYAYFRDYGRKAEETEDPERFEGRNELLIFGKYSPTSPWYPLPDHVPAIGSMVGDEKAEAYQLQFFDNNAVPRIAIIVEGGRLTPETKTMITEYLRSGVKGNAHKTLFLETEAEAGSEVRVRIERLTTEQTEDAAFTKYRWQSMQWVIMAHRVSPSKVTIVENANLANSKDQDKTFKEQVVRPDQERYEERINWLLDDELGLSDTAVFRFNEMDLADEEQIARTRSYYAPAVLNNEVRQWAGLDPFQPETEEDPQLVAFGNTPFKTTAPSFNLSGAAAGQGNQMPDFEALLQKAEPAPEHRAFVEAALQLGVLIERIVENAAPDA